MSGRYESIFLDGFSNILSSIFLWLPLLLLTVLIILRNNDSKNSIRIFVALSFSVSASILTSRHFSPTATNAATAFCLSVFLIWLFRDLRTSFLLLATAAIYSLTYIYKGATDFTVLLTGIVSGSIISTVTYLIFKILSRRKYRFYWNNHNTEYSKNGYLVSDLEWIFCMVYTLFMIATFYAIVT